MLTDWLDCPITSQGLPYSMRHNQQLLIKAGGSLSREKGGMGQLVKAPPAQGQSDQCHEPADLILERLALHLLL